MLQNDKVRLRAIGRDDLPALARFNNDRDVELAGGGSAVAPGARATNGRIRSQMEPGRAGWQRGQRGICH